MMYRGVRSFVVKALLSRQRGLLNKIEEFVKIQFLSAAELKEYQNEKLRRLVAHAYETVPHYRDLFKSHGLGPDDVKTVEDLQKVPILDKETLRSDSSRFLSSAAGGRLATRKTSGSTGVPLNIVNDRAASTVEAALYYRALRVMKYEWGDPLLFFWGVHPVQSMMTRFREGIRRNLYNLTFHDTYDVDDEAMKAIVEEIRKRPPKVIFGYTSSIYYLALRALREGISLPLNAVATTAEKLYHYQRSKIEEAFGCNLFDQYGCGETNSLAFECEEHKGLHVCAEHVVFETVDDEGVGRKQGNVVITNLDNLAMPLIRYHNGDAATWAQGSCPCQRGLPLLSEIDGRVYDFIEGSNGRKVHAGFIDEIFLDMDLDRKYAIREFRVIQERIDRLVVEFVTEAEVQRSDQIRLEEKINEYLGDTEVLIKTVRSIPRTAASKKVFVQSLLSRESRQPDPIAEGGYR